MWREFPDHPAVNLHKRCEISRSRSGFLRQPKHDSQHSRRIPTFRLINRRTFAPFTKCANKCLKTVGFEITRKQEHSRSGEQRHRSEPPSAHPPFGNLAGSCVEKILLV